jgi:hypothetical protein
MINFQQYGPGDDLEFINNLFGGEGNRLMSQLDETNFKAGVEAATKGLAPAKTWCKPYMAAYRTSQVVMAAVAEMVSA